MRKTYVSLLLVGIFVFSVVASGCISGTSQTSTSGGSPTGSATQTTVAEQLIIGVTDKVTDIDPANAYDFYTWEVLNNVMEGLVKYEPGTLKIVPGLAEKWEVNANSTVWTFHLRKGLKFDDGTPFTAKDVVRSINRVMTIK